MNRLLLPTLGRTLGVVLSAMIGASLSGGPPARAEDGPTPLGIWEVANAHDLPVRAAWSAVAGGLLVVSDGARQVTGIRPDSGLAVWRRDISNGAAVSTLSTTHAPDGDVVLLADQGLTAYRADVGTRLWELPWRCERGLCDGRIVYAGPIEGRGEGRGQSGKPDLKMPALLVARGGAVQTEVVRLDPRTGRPLWGRALAVTHPRRVLVAPSFAAIEEAVAPFDVAFANPVSGEVLGRWARQGASPPSELFAQADQLVAVDLRTGGGALARLTVLDRSGRVVTERELPRPAALSGLDNAPVSAALVGGGLGVFTPVSAERKAVLSVLKLESPWTVRTEVFTDLRGTGEALGALGAGQLRFGGDAAWFVTRAGPRTVAVNAVHVTRSDARLEGFTTEPSHVEPLGDGLILLAPGRDGASLVTVDRRGRFAFGAPELAGPPVFTALAGDGLLVVTRGAGDKPDRLEHLELVAWPDAVSRLRAAHERGADLAPLLTRLSRFYPIHEAVGGDVAAGIARPGELSAADLALVSALRETWRGADAVGTLDGLRDLIEREPERSERRLALLHAAAVLTLDMVLAVGKAVRPEVAERLVALARLTEFEGQRCARGDCAVSPQAVAVFGATMALVDEPLAGADLLAKAGTPLSKAARLELARRALATLRKSAGSLKTDTSRQMLVSGLRFFLHFDDVFGPDAPRAAALLDVATHDVAAALELERLLEAAEGPDARKKGLQPNTCQLACESAESLCGEVRGRLMACVDRCRKTGAVRFSNTTRPSGDPRWYCR